MGDTAFSIGVENFMRSCQKSKQSISPTVHQTVKTIIISLLFVITDNNNNNCKADVRFIGRKPPARFEEDFASFSHQTCAVFG
jgi:hypothetical protein